MEYINPDEDNDILKESDEGISAFLDSIGENGVHKRIFLEELFKILLKDKK